MILLAKLGVRERLSLNNQIIAGRDMRGFTKEAVAEDKGGGTTGCNRRTKNRTQHNAIGKTQR